jgi:flap endonuclease-1
MVQYDLEEVLKGLKFDREQFIDFCILCGCDLAGGKIKNVAGKRALSLIQAHKSIENIIRTIDQTKYPVPECFDFNAARVEFGIKC